MILCFWKILSIWLLRPGGAVVTIQYHKLILPTLLSTIFEWSDAVNTLVWYLEVVGAWIGNNRLQKTLARSIALGLGAFWFQGLISCTCSEWSSNTPKQNLCATWESRLASAVHRADSSCARKTVWLHIVCQLCPFLHPEALFLPWSLAECCNILYMSIITNINTFWNFLKNWFKKKPKPLWF